MHQQVAGLQIAVKRDATVFYSKFVVKDQYILCIHKGLVLQPPLPSKSTDPQVPYIKRHSICI